ncbi:unnamed protein product [Acanthoscelides obtectus]|uniref:Peptidase S1 domain-containing protein n=1 Tax=Acanthoscelides obtectus TaxID=200917 RepID=A0A9P0KV83_ACAOB|nr:unnamed protein product [Acanthoscelides obtectus]CAK1643988.1 hypothetical protein AOBTE_LOCUS13767 [Acanthoscelides obtectus]
MFTFSCNNTEMNSCYIFSIKVGTVQLNLVRKIYEMSIHILIFSLCIAAIIAADHDVSHHPNWKYLDSEKCGYTRYQETKYKIVSGKAALLGEFPWIVRLGRKYRNFLFFDCAGTLINRYYVLTAGHCDKRDDVARLGENYNDSPVDCDAYECAPGVQDIKVDKYLEFGFEPRTHYRDLMLVKLREPAQFNEYVVPACLPKGPILKTDFLGKTVQIAGWGFSNVRTRYVPSNLQYIGAPVLSRQVCSNIFINKLTESQMCIGFESGKDSCAGDSGGPVTKNLIVDGKRRHYLLGLVSYGMINCGHGPAVYTNVSYYMKDILDKIEKN